MVLYGISVAELICADGRNALETAAVRVKADRISRLRQLRMQLDRPRSAVYHLLRDDGIHVDGAAVDRPAGNLIAEVFFGNFIAQLIEQVAERGELPERRAERIGLAERDNLALAHAVNHETELRRDRPRLQIGVHDHGRGNGIRERKVLTDARGVGVIPTFKVVAEITVCLRRNRLVRLVIFPDGGVLPDRDRPEQFAVESDEVDGDLSLRILRRNRKIGSHVVDGRRSVAFRNAPAEEVPAVFFVDCGDKEFKRFGSARPVQNVYKRKLLRCGKIIAFPPIKARRAKLRLHSGIDGIGVSSERNRNCVCRSPIARVNRL